MKILFFTQSGPTGAASRYRVYQYLPYVRSAGWIFWVAPGVPDSFYRIYFGSRSLFWKALFSVCIVLRRIAQLWRVPLADVVFIQKPLLPVGWPVLEPLVAAMAKKVVFDFDDAIFMPSPFSPRTVSAAALQRRFEKIIQSADLVLAGNLFLAQAAAPKARRVEIVPTVVDPDWFRPVAPVSRSTIVIGWMGSHTTAGYLGDLQDVMRTLSQQFSLRWIFVGAPPIELPGVDAVFEPWNYETEVARLQSFDIFISPLRDTPWEEGKCGLKTLTAMATGLPVVASAVGVHKEIIQDGFNGFLASGPQEWQDKLSQLLSDAALRERLGRAARKTVEEKFNLAGEAIKWGQVFKRTMGSNL